MASWANLSDIQGLVQLGIDQAKLITDVVEDVHSTVVKPINSVVNLPLEGHIRALVYRIIREGYRLSSAGAEAVFTRLIPMVDTPPSTLQREAMLAILNGIWGDHLLESNNPLAITMSLRNEGQPLPLEKAVLQNALSQASGKVLILVHGLCMTDLQWTRGNHNHGAVLARDLGYTPIYLHYNSGLHISTNGRQFAALLDKLIREWPQPIEEITIIGHSMGGLVARSACYYALAAGHTWPEHLQKLIFLGTPHHGAPLERTGNWAETILNSTPYTAPFRRIGAKRSAGITDLRYGSLVDEDWEGRDRFALEPTDNRRIVPLPPDVTCYAIAATLGAQTDDLKNQMLGDGLVPLESALGIHNDPARCLDIPESHQWIGYEMQHLDLLNQPDGYQRIKDWLQRQP
ncbi:MAG: GPI inositol-deacylase [Anaerolineae bacterium]|nr:GPI inositol-deacylase [Anaerolineae bacterium]